jgi:flagellar biosynthesis protein FliQ
MMVEWWWLLVSLAVGIVVGVRVAVYSINHDIHDLD